MERLSPDTGKLKVCGKDSIRQGYLHIPVLCSAYTFSPTTGSYVEAWNID
jgi:hypothetical protein